MLIAALVAMHLFLQFVPLPNYPGDIMLREFIHFGREASFVTWLSSMLWMTAATAAALIGIARKEAPGNNTYWWWGFALVPLAISIDEVASVHEVLADKTTESLNLGGAIYTAWDIPISLIALLMVAIFVRFWLRLPAWLRIRTALAAGLAFGSILMEVVGAAVGTTEWLKTGTAYLLANTIEETLEMIGALVLAGALLRYLAAYGDGTPVRLVAATPESSDPRAEAPASGQGAYASSRIDLSEHG